MEILLWIENIKYCAEKLFHHKFVRCAWYVYVYVRARKVRIARLMYKL